MYILTRIPQRCARNKTYDSSQGPVFYGFQERAKSAAEGFKNAFGGEADQGFFHG